MPKITITYEPGEKEDRNATGKKLNLIACPICGDHWNVKPFHEISYHHGIFEVPHNDRKPGDEVLLVKGHKGYSPICEECWEAMGVEKRVEMVSQCLGKKPSAVRHALRVPDGRGGFSEDQDDAIRYAREAEAEKLEQLAIIDAVKAGG